MAANNAREWLQDREAHPASEETDFLKLCGFIFSSAAFQKNRRQQPQPPAASGVSF